MRASRRVVLQTIASYLVWPLAFSVLPAVRAGSGEQHARELAKKILALTGPHPALFLSTRNISSLGPMEAAQLARALETELRAQGARLIATVSADLEVHVTLSEDLRNFLWIAEVRRKEMCDVVMVAFPRYENPRQNASAMQLGGKLIWTQPEPVLDFALLPSPSDQPPRMLVLEPRRLVLYGFEQGHWQVKEYKAIEHNGTGPRDPRGRLSVSSGDSEMEVYLPGLHCDGAIDDALKLDCETIRERPAEWPLYAGGEERGSVPFVLTKNYFEGPLTLYVEGGRAAPAFYSAAGIAVDNDSMIWILAGLDGKTHIYGDASHALAEWSGWGSDLVSLAATCGSGWPVLATRSGDWTERDAIQTFEIVEHQAVPVGDAMQFAGPVTALWPAADGATANAVVKNLDTKQYEAFTISVSCTR